MIESLLSPSLCETYPMKRGLRRKAEIDGPFGQISAYATITDLPDELVEKIVDDLDDNGSICRLSLTCKRLHFLVLPTFFVEIESASFDYSRDQNKIENKIPVVSVSDRGKRMGNYCTNSGIYTVDYENKRR